MIKGSSFLRAPFERDQYLFQWRSYPRGTMRDGENALESCSSFDIFMTSFSLLISASLMLRCPPNSFVSSIVLISCCKVFRSFRVDTSLARVDLASYSYSSSLSRTPGLSATSKDTICSNSILSEGFHASNSQSCNNLTNFHRDPYRPSGILYSA